MSKKRSISNNDDEQQQQQQLHLETSTKKHKSINGELELFSKLDDNILYEIFKHADARNLAVFSCVSKIWNRTAQDERLWEMICTRRWIDVNHTGGEKQLRSVVLALGGFRRLYSLYLSKTVSPSRAPPALSASRRRWGKDEVNLSLSLLSIQFYNNTNNFLTNKKGN